MIEHAHHHGLDTILRKRGRLFLIDTGVLFLGYMRGKYKHGDTVQIVQSMKKNKLRSSYIQIAYEIMTSHKNIRVTPESHHESIDTLNSLKGRSRSKKYQNLVNSLINYLMNNRESLIVQRKLPHNSNEVSWEYFLTIHFKERLPELKPVSLVDISLILTALSSMIYGGKTPPIEIICSDYGIIRCAETMMDHLDGLPHLTRKQKRTIPFKCMQIYSREHDEENYRVYFDSAQYCRTHESLVG